MAMYSWFHYPLKMVMFHSYVSLPGGNSDLLEPQGLCSSAWFAKPTSHHLIDPSLHEKGRNANHQQQPAPFSAQMPLGTALQYSNYILYYFIIAQRKQIVASNSSGKQRWTTVNSYNITCNLLTSLNLSYPLVIKLGNGKTPGSSSMILPATPPFIKCGIFPASHVIGIVISYCNSLFKPQL